MNTCRWLLIRINNNIYNKHLTIFSVIHAQNTCNNDTYMLKKIFYVVCCKTCCKSVQCYAFLLNYTCFYTDAKAISAMATSKAKRVAAARKAARTRKRNAAAKAAASKKAAARRKRRVPARKTARRRTTRKASSRRRTARRRR